MAEITRVVKPGGRIVVLEIVKPDGRFMSKLFPLYFCTITPILGALFAGEREAYSYLPESVQGFMTASELSYQMECCGLENVRISQLALGSMAIVAATVPFPTTTDQISQ
jgi:demethylmenaquinone methyltransferase/2-methoxy-6-polyprenyl-1,4-benzoquinol methylase